MTVLNANEIAGYAQAAGFTGSAIGYIVAIGLAESGGNLQIVSPVQSDGTRGYGLFQIETENVGSGGNWQDPTWQAQKAYAMSSQGTNFEPWCTACAPMPISLNGVSYQTGCKGFGSGAARAFLAQGSTAAGSPLAVNGSGVALDASSADPANTAGWSASVLAANAKHLPRLAVLSKVDTKRIFQAALVPGEWRFPYNSMGAGLIQAVLTESTVDLTQGQIPQIQLTVADPSFQVFASVVGSVKQQDGHEGLLCQWMDEVMILAEVQTTNVNMVPATILTMSSAVFAWMQTQRFKTSSELSATDWIREVVGFYNATLPKDKPAATFNGQPTKTRANTTNLDMPIVQWVSYFDYATTLAEQEGCWLFESGGGVWFGEPPWIYSHMTSALRVGWPGIKGSRPYNQSQVDVEALEAPVILRSQTLFTGDTMTLQLPRAIGEQVRVGMIIHMFGMGPSDATQWLVQQVTFPYDGGATPVQVQCNEAKRIVPPEPGGYNPPPPLTDPTNPGSGAPGAVGVATASTQRFVNYALSQAGDAYSQSTEQAGTNGSGSFDCSGLVQWCVQQCGLFFPRDTYSQYSYLKQQNAIVSVDKAYHTYGALLYAEQGPNGPGHVAISLGDGVHIFQESTYGQPAATSALPESSNFFYTGALVPGLAYPGTTSTLTGPLPPGTA